LSPTYRATFTNDLRNVALARNAIASFARLCGFDSDSVADIRLAAGEALSNAAEHGRGERPGGFSVRCLFENDEFVIEVQDSGRGFHHADGHLLGPDEHGRGFGINIMRRLMNSIAFSKNGTNVRLVKRLDDSSPRLRHPEPPPSS
jgi:anti-sigma regulatory factor (Ser/Thr protein kinase)